MQDSPDSLALLEIIGETLRDEIIPQLEGPAVYHARIAANLLSIVIRASRASAGKDAVETASLQQLLGAADSDLSTLNAAFAVGLRDRTLTLDTPGVAEHLWRTTLAKLAVDQPDYARYRQTVETHDVFTLKPETLPPKTGGVAPQGANDAAM
jgi:hypothetical protein